MIKSNTNHIGFEDTTCPMGVEAVLVHVVHAGIAIGPEAPSESSVRRNRYTNK